MVRYKIKKKVITIDFAYNEQIIQRLKKVFINASYNPELKIWSIDNNPFNLNRLEQLIEDFGGSEIENFGGFKEVSEIGLPEPEVIDVIKGIILDDKRFKMKPRDYQFSGITYMVDKETCINGDDMGLGKTGQAICSIEVLRAFPCLVVAPSNVKFNWLKEWNKWVHNPDVSVIDKKDKNFDSDIVIINYDILKKYNKELGKKKWCSMIVDESHYVKKASAQRSKVVKKLSKSIPIKFLLSGTAVENRPSELINQFNILGVFDDLFGNWKKFIYRFCDARSNGFGLDYSGSSNKFELNKIMRENCYISRKKSEVSDSLPTVQRQNLIVPSTNTSKYNRMMKNFLPYLKKEYGDEKVGSALEAIHLVQLSEMRKLSIEGKMNSIFEWVDNFLESTDEKLLIFATSTSPIVEIENRYKAMRIDGSVDAKKKFNLVQEFQTNDNRILVGNILSLGTGTDGLQNICSNALFVQLPDKSSTDDQAISRLHRSGQKDPVMVTNLFSDYFLRMV